jgi:hypothetical protein
VELSPFSSLLVPDSGKFFLTTRKSERTIFPPEENDVLRLSRKEESLSVDHSNLDDLQKLSNSLLCGIKYQPVGALLSFYGYSN